MNQLTLKTGSCQRTIRRTIRVQGIVQGVGFRPTVWRYANELDIQGHIFNDSDGVIIECRGTEQAVYTLIERLHREPPPQAQISHIEHWKSDTDITGSDFVIIKSRTLNQANTGISPDLATCPECLAEVLTQGNRRYGYPFTNCTHCGPRLSIVRSVPYDRANTSMSQFQQCSRCTEEYEDPANRRFHAQPNACPDCGPTLWITSRTGQRLGGNAITTAVARLQQGAIVAIKGIGGFQLVVDACNQAAVAELRQRKHRPHKPFALMARDISVIHHYCEITEQEQQLLESPAAPIVILSQCSSSIHPLPENIAPDQNRLGFMLPTTPLHHLLLAEFDTPLIMTSGNPSGEPQCIDNQQALDKLSTIADLFVLHNRDILNRCDDSIVQVVNQQRQLLRRARGFAPAPLSLPAGLEGSPDILAMGAELKNTFCLVRGNQAILSPHIGDLQDIATFKDFRHSLSLFQQMHQHQPEAIAIDQHPQYLSGKWGWELADEHELPVLEIQHHHAHIAACLGDNRWPLDAPPVLAVTLDGIGFSQTPDNQKPQLWGGEIFLADYRQATRLARLKPIALPGTNMAMQQPWRNCVAQLHSALGWQKVAENYAKLPLIKTLSLQPINNLLTMIDKDINAPISSSCGRLFDAVAAATGINLEGNISYEGQAAMTLEASINEADWQIASPYPFKLNKRGGLLEIDPSPLWSALLDDLVNGCNRSLIASRFHLGLIEAIANCLTLLAEQQQTSTVALSGGVFQNPRLSTGLQQQLQLNGLQVLTHRNVPANDGGIALGQALIAAAQLKPNSQGERTCT
ncbi:MAG: carbamoyltransferase HypF [Porticoccus sp.]|nr:carbamoyltransferase HypF [Porticoccus sp.]